jgi:hypothetical protein
MRNPPGSSHGLAPEQQKSASFAVRPINHRIGESESTMYVEAGGPKSAYLQQNKEKLEAALTAAMHTTVSSLSEEPVEALAAALAKEARCTSPGSPGHAANIAAGRLPPSLQQHAQRAVSSLDHSTKLDIYSAPGAGSIRQTGIICTIGPNTKAPEMLTTLREAGLNVVRMNFSHGSHEYHGEVIANTRKSVKDSPLDGRIVGIALDTKGPEIRTGLLKGGGSATIVLEKGAKIKVTVDPAHKDECCAERLYMDYANLPKARRCRRRTRARRRERAPERASHRRRAPRR